MLFYLTARIVSSATAFLYPGYASYKVLSQRPASEEDLERWLMYWSVLGCIVGVEYLAEWLVSWIPLYYPLKTLFLLYLVLPQTQGASYVYSAHLRPFFRAHETQIDAALVQLRARVYRFVQERLRAVWDAAAGAVHGPQQAAADAGADAEGTARERGMAPVQIVGSLWRAYGPGIVASGAALLRSAAPPRASTLRTPPPPPTNSASASAANVNADQTLLERRRKLEAELAALDTLIPPTRSSTSTSTSTSASSSGLGLRERTNSGTGRFEEIEVPSDVEGYDVGGGASGGGEERGQAKGWFGWAVGGAYERAGYERVKSE